MTGRNTQFRIATYNIHKARGFDLRIVPERIVEVVQELDADILCLQEVIDAPEGQPNLNQARRSRPPSPAITRRSAATGSIAAAHTAT